MDGQFFDVGDILFFSRLSPLLIQRSRLEFSPTSGFCDSCIVLPRQIKLHVAILSGYLRECSTWLYSFPVFCDTTNFQLISCVEQGPLALKICSRACNMTRRWSSEAKLDPNCAVRMSDDVGRDDCFTATVASSVLRYSCSRCRR